MKKDQTKEHNLELGLFALVFALALTIRLLRLGELPLTDDEARLALQALDLTRGLRPEMAPYPAYINLTALAFFLLQASSFAARLVPAFFGSLLVLAPIPFRARLGSKPALILSFLMAFDPALLGLSRLSNSPLIAVCALLFAWAAWQNENPTAAGIWFGLALLGGPALWPGLLGLAVTWTLLRGFFTRTSAQTPAPFDRASLTHAALYAAGTYFLAGSLFLAARGGLGAGLAAIPAYFGGWVSINDVSLGRMLLGLLIYELLGVTLAVIGLVRGIRSGDEMTISLGVWLAVSLVLALANPSRQAADLVWVVLPLLALAARELAEHIRPILDGVWETLGMTIFTASILTFTAMNYSAIALTQIDQSATQVRWWIMLGSLGLLAISILMVGYGWSLSTALQGGAWGGLLVLAVFSLSNAAASSGLRTYRTTEMWSASPGIDQSATLIRELNELSRWKTGVNAGLDVSISGIDSPALVWALRGFPVTLSPSGGLEGSPQVVITTENFPSANMESTYRGQDLDWRSYPAWNQGLPADWLQWSLLHQFPAGKEKVILWVRSDVFVDSQNNQ